MCSSGYARWVVADGEGLRACVSVGERVGVGARADVIATAIRARAPTPSADDCR